MGFSNLNYLSSNELNRLLSKIVSNPELAVLQQKSISAEATNVLLSSILRDFRFRQGVFNSLDVREISAQAISMLHHMAEHDPLHYLTLIRRYDLIREYFGDKAAFGKQLALIDEIEKAEKAYEQYRHELSLVQKKLQDNQNQLNKLALEKQKAEERLLIHLNSYLYLYLQHRYIQQVFYEQQIAIYSLATQNRLARINKVIGIVEGIISFPDSEKKKIHDLYKHYEDEYTKIESRPTKNADASINYKALQRKHYELEQLDEKYGKLLSDFLNTHQEHPELKLLLQEEQKETTEYRAELSVIKAERDQALAEILPHLINARVLVKTDLINQISKFIEILERYKLKQPDSILKLTQCKRGLESTHDDEEIQSILKVFTQEMNEVKATAKLQLSQEEYKKFELEIEIVSKMDSAVKVSVELSEIPLDLELEPKENATHSYRDKLHEIKEEPEQCSSVITAPIMVIVLEEDLGAFQLVVENALDPIAIDSLKEECSCSSEKLEKIERLEILLQAMADSECKEVVESDLIETYQLVEEFMVYDDRLCNSKEQLATLFPFLEDASPKPSF